MKHGYKQGMNQGRVINSHPQKKYQNSHQNQKPTLDIFSSITVNVEKAERINIFFFSIT